MIEPKLEVPAELRDLAEKTIDQAEKAFGMFFDAAGKSMTSMPGAGTEISRQALTFTEQNMKAAFEHARKLVHATDLQEAMRIQSEFLRSQFTNAGEHMRQITGGVMSAAKDSTKGKFCASSVKGSLAAARDRDAEQKGDEQAGQRRFPGNRADGRERHSRSPCGCDRVAETAGRGLQRVGHFRERA